MKLTFALVCALVALATAHSYTAPTAAPTSYVAPTVAPTAAPTAMPSTCWYEKRKCRWEASTSGYRCKDYYGEKYARCHPMMKYKKKCDKAEIMPSPRPTKPEDYTVWEQTKSTLVSYDTNYGPHVANYPAGGASDYYYTGKLPKHPHGVKDKPVPAPTAAPKYTAPPTAAPKYTAPPTVAPKTSGSGGSKYTTPPAHTAPPQTSGSGGSRYTTPPAPAQPPQTSGNTKY